MSIYVKSPIFYMGNKYELLPQLLDIFPRNIETFYDMFGGSGVVSLNVRANKIIYNELNHNIIELLKLFKLYTPKEINQHILKRIEYFNLPKEAADIRQNTMNDELRNKAKEKYVEFRTFYNKSDKNYLDLFTLTFFSFCNLIRFNSKSEFNMPFGNSTYNKEKYCLKMQQAYYQIKKRDFDIMNKNVFDILKETQFNENDFVYLDPPYLNTEAIYNEKRAFGGWCLEDDLKLFEELDKLSLKSVKWCLSNVKENKGKTNTHLIKWANEHNYRIVGMRKNYSALGKGNANTYEICVINYDYSGDGFKVIQETLF